MCIVFSRNIELFGLESAGILAWVWCVSCSVIFMVCKCLVYSNKGCGQRCFLAVWFTVQYDGVKMWFHVNKLSVCLYCCSWVWCGVILGTVWPEGGRCGVGVVVSVKREGWSHWRYVKRWYGVVWYCGWGDQSCSAVWWCLMWRGWGVVWWGRGKGGSGVCNVVRLGVAW